MDTLELDLNKKYTFADYLLWADDKRRELIKGFIKLMSPAPARKHQDISGSLFFALAGFLKSKSDCRIYHAPFDVRFPNKKGDVSDETIHTVVQPDISVICDMSKLDDKGCIGAPDLIVEILSPATVKKDVEEKYKLYEEQGVKEYWIVHPNDETLSIFYLDNKGKYQLQGIYAKGSKVDVHIFKGKLTVDLNDIFIE